MILVDTSVWIDHLRSTEEELTQLLLRCQVMAHPFVIGELALGKLRQRNEVLHALQNLPQVPLATENEMLGFIEQNCLYGLGIGYIDAHLLAATHLAPGTTLWTRDKRLLSVSARLGVAKKMHH
jgi:predicted nucleic acid-binding protein